VPVVEQLNNHPRSALQGSSRSGRAGDHNHNGKKGKEESDSITARGSDHNLLNLMPNTHSKEKESVNLTKLMNKLDE